MPWCPKCKNEYVEGIKECADCKVPLVDELPSEEEVFDENIQILPEEEKDSTETKRPNNSWHYENYHDKAENFKSSAYTLIIVGIAGIAALILIELGVLPIHLGGASKYMTNIVMGALFVIFLICGLRSIKTYKKYEKEAISEDEKTKEIKDWIAKNVNGNEIEQKVLQIQQDMTKEIKYFYCYSALKDLIANQFPGLEEAYLDHLVEEAYPSLFEQNASIDCDEE